MKLNYKNWQLIFFRFLEVWMKKPTCTFSYGGLQCARRFIHSHLKETKKINNQFLTEIHKVCFGDLFFLFIVNLKVVSGSRKILFMSCTAKIWYFISTNETNNRVIQNLLFQNVTTAIDWTRQLWARLQLQIQDKYCQTILRATIANINWAWAQQNDLCTQQRIPQSGLSCALYG